MRRALFIFLAWVLLPFSLAFGAPARAEDTGVDQQIEQTRSQLQKAKKQEQSALSVLNRNQKDLNKIQSNLNVISGQLQSAQVRAANARQELQQVEAELTALEEKLDQRRILLSQRVNTLYRYGPISYLEVLFSATSFRDLVNRYELSSYFVRNDLQMLDGYQETYREIETKSKDIKAHHYQDLQARSQAISALQARAANEKQRAAEKVRSTQARWPRFRRIASAWNKALNELERLSKQLGNQMRKKGSGVALGTGRMMWPVLGRLSSSYGWRRHPVLRTNKSHHGQDIAVPKGTPVLAVDSGIVRIAGWQGGYGYLVAIDHGKGLSTFYGHNSVLLVKEGDVVIKAQRIALSGSTGLSTGPHVHFEVRINGEPVKPNPVSAIEG